ncbi:hypothetical protein [Nannocystis sp. SCPEA4]|uniref:hypothetical protein n=1 Tax=Nannocystis sp. SCPEA4 TaxID=2996787 RepID=UPI0022703E74|nr:hypothetical protein [Nannocystis sp. SCPEA4]MCY1060558.1 hypothetical protein [Nannocystis sp. SCPEA4]
MLTILLGGCTPTPNEEPVAAPTAVPAPPPTVAPPTAATAGTGRDERDSLAIDCVRAIASRQEDDRTIVYITLAEPGSVRPGQWVHCAHEDRPPSPPCEVLDIVDGGMLEARCGQAAS